MKIDLSKIDLTQFMVHQHIVNGEVMHLVQPQHIGAKWSQDNKIFRSSLWNDAGESVSLSFPKFTNWGENPDNFPVPTTLKDTICTEKIDGSLLIVSKYNGNYILRTRGTVDATELEKNGDEIEIFKSTILPQLQATARINGHKSSLDPVPDTWPCSVLFEWVSPKQKIILSYGDTPAWYLVGIVNHDDYSLEIQTVLDDIARFWAWKRPVTHTFPDVQELQLSVDEWKGKEGVVVYSKDGQALHKCKSSWYLALHRMKEEFGSVERLVDNWIIWGMPDYQKTEELIVNQFDYELFQSIRGDVSRICDAWKNVIKIEAGMNTFIRGTILSLGDPKDKKARGQMALKVLAAYGNTNRANFIFKLMDGRPLDKDDYKKLLYQCLKK